MVICRSRFVNKFGFRVIAIKGHETGNKDYKSILLKNDNVLLAVETPLGNKSSVQLRMNDFLSRASHGLSGVVYGLLGYLLVIGWLEKRPLSLILSVLALVSYGGVLPSLIPLFSPAGLFLDLIFANHKTLI